MLNLLFALLELDYGLMRARTPYYEVYTIKQKSSAGWSEILSQTDPFATAIRAHWTGAANKQVIEPLGVAVDNR